MKALKGQKSVSPPSPNELAGLSRLGSTPTPQCPLTRGCLRAHVASSSPKKGLMRRVLVCPRAPDQNRSHSQCVLLTRMAQPPILVSALGGKASLSGQPRNHPIRPSGPQGFGRPLHGCGPWRGLTVG